MKEINQCCRICQADHAQQSIRAEFVYGGRPEHKFWECKSCSIIYLDPPLSKEEEKKFYIKEFESFMSKRVGDHRDWSNAELHNKTNQDQVLRRMPFLEEHLRPNIDLLEVGCSSGFMLDAFTEKGLNCYGVEPSGEFGDFLSENGHRHFQNLSDIKDQTFDVITHFFVLEHISDPFDFIERQLELLNPNGVIIAEVPCANDPLTSIYSIDAFEQFYWSIAHHYYYNPDSLSFILDKINCKYKIIPEQRYDLSNHITWLMDGKPGGQGRFSELFGADLIQSYKKRMIESWQCDTMFVYIWKD